MKRNNTRRGFTQAANEVAVYKNGHSRELLSGISTLFKTQGGDPRQRHSGMTFHGTTTCGFTLIELLVVVLIIGILAAVALPQYNKAVEKSRAVEALTMINSLQKAVDAAILAGNLDPNKDVAFFATAEEAEQHGEQSATLDIDFPWDEHQKTKHFQYSITAINGGKDRAIEVIRLEKENGVPIYQIGTYNNGTGWVTYCLYHYAHTSGRGKTLCESLQGMGITAEENNLE